MSFVTSQPKLKIGDKIRVHGFVMLADMPEGDYRVHSMPPYYGVATYQFCKAKGRKVVARHHFDHIDTWIKPADDPDINRIEKL